jgi:3-carboxy-cis,cis-muconate cycloisomerase
MPLTFLESDIYRQLLGAAKMRAVFSDAAMVRSWIDFERALAVVQCEFGVLTCEQASKLEAVLAEITIAPSDLAEATAFVGRPIVPLIERLRQALGPNKDALHKGAATQDVIDTGAVLQIRDGLNLIEEQLRHVLGLLLTLARDHRATVMAGRTNSMQAAPLTFGFKVVSWAGELARTLQRINELRSRVLKVQLAGPIGTLAAMGPRAMDIRQALAQRLGLGVETASWSSARDAIAETVFALGLISTSLGRVGAEVGFLARTEIGELAESAVLGQGGSSSLPQKNNPRCCEFLEAMGRIVHSQAGLIYGGSWHQNERHGGAWAIEWHTVPQFFILASTSLEMAEQLLVGLDVDAERMRSNLFVDGGRLFAEAAAVSLASQFGQVGAKKYLASAARKAQEQKISLREATEAVLAEEGRNVPDGWSDAFTPEMQIGFAPRMVDMTCEEIEALLRK